jgi:hypothetical protein
MVEEDSIMAEIEELERYIYEAGLTDASKRSSLSSEGSGSSVPSLTTTHTAGSVTGDSDEEDRQSSLPTPSGTVNLAPWSPLKIKKKKVVPADLSSAVRALPEVQKPYMAPISQVPVIMSADWDGSSAGFMIISLKNARQRELIKRVTGQDYLFL